LLINLIKNLIKLLQKVQYLILFLIKFNVERILKEQQFITPEEKFKLLSNKQLINIIKMKNKETTQKVSDYIKEHYNICINRNFISKLWSGEDINLTNSFSEEILNSQEYQNMKLNPKQKVVKSKKFNNEEIDWVLKTNLDKSLSERVILFQTQFNKTITKAYLSKLSK
jgi:transposase